MVSWVVVLGAFLAGGMFGVLIAAILVSSRDGRGDGDR